MTAVRNVILQLSEISSAALLYDPDTHVVQRFATGRGGIEPSGIPSDDICASLANLKASLDIDAASVTLLVPGRLLRARAVAIDIPLGGPVSNAAVNQACDLYRKKAGLPGTVDLHRQPTHCDVDGVPFHHISSGQTGERLTVSGCVVSMRLPMVRKFDRAMEQIGWSMNGIMAPYTVLPRILEQSAENDVLIDVAFGETVLGVFRDQQLDLAACVPIGLRHIISDVIAVCRLDPAEARMRVARYLRTGPTEHDRVSDVIFARIEELACVIAEHLACTDVPSARISVFGMLRDSAAAEGIFHRHLGDCSLYHRRIHTRKTLEAAAETVSGQHGPYVPAALSEAIEQPVAQRAFSWLRDRF